MTHLPTHRTHRPDRRSPGTTRLAVLATMLAMACLLSPLAAEPASAETLDDPITRAHVLERAKNWSDRNVQYDQGATALAPGGGRRYRTDCSGFVSMAWHISPTGMSAPWTGLLKTTKYTKKISKANLKPGDALISSSHAVLFHKWTNAAHTRFKIYELANPSQDMNHREVTLASVSGYGAYRYKNIRN